MNTKQAEWARQLLAAAEALLEARGCQMVTAAEWQALSAAVRSARRQRKTGQRKPRTEKSR